MLRQDHRDEQYTGSTIISFKREVDAMHFAHMIECHKQNTNNWPSATLNGLTSLFVMAKQLNEPYLPNELYLKTWDLSTLRMYCASNILNLFVMQTMTMTDESTYRIKGEHVTLSIPIEMYAEIFEKMYKREKIIKDINDEWE
jgi:hypothetical protein